MLLNFTVPEIDDQTIRSMEKATILQHELDLRGSDSPLRTTLASVVSQDERPLDDGTAPFCKATLPFPRARKV
jgi:hypothetical protein